MLDTRAEINSECTSKLADSLGAVVGNTLDV